MAVDVESIVVRARPRIAGPRENEIFDVTLALLAEMGYDRLTMDAVASAAHAGKASLYRRWRNKAELVTDTFDRCAVLVVPDTGTLRGDLLGAACGEGGMLDEAPVALMASLLTALHTDADLSEAFSSRFMAPRLALSRAIFSRAQERGEIAPGVDLDLLVDLLPSLVMHRLLLRGETPTVARLARLVDEVVLPAAHRLSVPAP